MKKNAKVVLPVWPGDKVMVQTSTLRLDELSLDGKEPPEYMAGEVGAVRFTKSKHYFKVYVYGEWLTECSDRHDEMPGSPMEYYTEFTRRFRSFSYPLWAYGKTVLAAEEWKEREKWN